MQVAILAGGLGTRLRGVVSEVPKSMAPIAGRPFLEHQLIRIRESGFSEVVLLVGYMDEAIIEQFGDGSALGLRIAYSREKEGLGTAGALKNAEALLDDRFVLLNGDTFFDVNYNELIKLDEDEGATVAIALVPVDDVSRYGAVSIDESGRVTVFSEKAFTGPGLINGGVYVVNKSILDLVEESEKVSLENEVIPELIRRGERVVGLVSEGYFVDIGTPESYEFAERHFGGGRDAT